MPTVTSLTPATALRRLGEMLFQRFDLPTADQRRQLVQLLERGIERRLAGLLELEVRGMTCGHCAMHVSKCLLGLPGVRGVKVDHQSGRVELRLDKTANIHVQIGKASFPAENLYDNFSALMEAIRKARPAAAKGNYIKHISVATTMGPGLKIDPAAVQSLEVGE